MDAARRNIEGEITIDEVKQLLKSYYESKTTRTPDDDEKEEADCPPEKLASPDKFPATFRCGNIFMCVHKYLLKTLYFGVCFINFADAKKTKTHYWHLASVKK